METKSIFKSVSVGGIVVAALSSFIHDRTGVNVSDQVAPFTASFQKLINDLPPVVSDIGVIAGLVTALIGRFKATQPLHVFAPGGAGNNSSTTGTSVSKVGMAFLMAAGLSAMTVTTGCSGSSTTTPGANQSTGAATTTSTGNAFLDFLENAVAPIAANEAGIQAVRQTTAQLAKPTGPTKAQLASDFLNLANAGDKIVTQQVTSQADIYAVFQSFKSDASTSQYDAEAQDMAEGLEAYIGDHPNAVLTSLVHDFFTGVKTEATAEGGTVPVAPIATGNVSL